jgi:hypothetical protein
MRIRTAQSFSKNSKEDWVTLPKIKTARREVALAVFIYALNS